MNSEACRAFAAADLPLLAQRAQRYAHNVMCKYRWFGLKVTARHSGVLVVDGMSPDDFVAEAIAKLCDGTRSFDPNLDLDANVNRTVESDIWNHKKKVDRKPHRDDRTKEEAEDCSSDPIEAVEDPRSQSPVSIERDRVERELLEGFAKEIESDEELSLVFMAYQDGILKTARIAEETGIPAVRVSELKRKLRQQFDGFMQEHPLESE